MDAAVLGSLDDEIIERELGPDVRADPHPELEGRAGPGRTGPNVGVPDRDVPTTDLGVDHRCDADPLDVCDREPCDRDRGGGLDENASGGTIREPLRAD